MDITKDKWIIERELTLRERETIFILAESAGMSVLGITRCNKTYHRDGNKHLRFDNECITGFGLTEDDPLWGRFTDHMFIEYEEVVELLKEAIKNREVV